MKAVGGETIPGEWWDRPLFQTVEGLQDAGRSVWVDGVDLYGYVLVVDGDNDVVSIAHADSYGTLGRFETPKRVYLEHGDVYRRRFVYRP